MKEFYLLVRPEKAAINMPYRATADIFLTLAYVVRNLDAIVQLQSPKVQGCRFAIRRIKRSGHASI
jgi:hypothetical protein